MRISLYRTSGTDNYNISNISNNKTFEDENLDKVRVLFEYLFAKEDNIVKQNKFLILFLQNYIKENQLEIVKRFLVETVAIKDLDISLIKSALLITDNIEYFSISRLEVCQIFNEKFKQLTKSNS